MTHGSRNVGPRRSRESFGRYYEEFEIGDVYEHRPGRTITETDNTWFTLLTMNNHPLHFDAVYAAKSEFGRPFVNSCLTLSIVVGMSVSDVSYKAIGNLGWTDIKLTGARLRRRHGLRGVRGDREARVAVAADARDRHRAHARQHARGQGRSSRSIGRFSCRRRGHGVEVVTAVSGASWNVSTDGTSSRCTGNSGGEMYIAMRSVQVLHRRRGTPQVDLRRRA